MKTEITIICITIIILYGMYLYYNYINPFVDSIEKEWNIFRVRSLTHIGYTILYKRTYKSGKVKFFKKTYDTINE